MTNQPSPSWAVELKPCPCCCGDARLVSGAPGCHYVRCDVCGLSTNDRSIEVAIAAWNQRPTPAAQELKPVAWMYEDCDEDQPFRHVQCERAPKGAYPYWTERALGFLDQIADQAKRSASPVDLEKFASALENGDFWNVSSHLNARMCCDGNMCGCRGSSVGEYLAYELRAALTTAIPAIRAKVVAEEREKVVAWLRDKPRGVGACYDPALLADAIEQGACDND